MTDDLAKLAREWREDGSPQEPFYATGHLIDAMADRIEELELAVRYEADLAQQALDARKELAAKLAKAAAEIEEAWKVPKSDASWGILQVMIKYALSELKGPDDAE